MGRAALVILDRLTETVACVDRFRLAAVAPTGDGAVVLAWESVEADALNFADGAPLGKQVIRDGSGSVAGQVGAGHIEWDITSLYKSWVEREPGPLVIVLQLAPYGQNGKVVRLQSVESGDGPTVSWASRCS